MTLQKDPEGNEKKYLHKIGDFKNKRVLEVGCGEGRLTWKYASDSTLTVGVDSDQTALRVARADSPASLHQQVHFAAANARNLPFKKETFDLAILSWSL
jgi:ubiquinone/menaquinone biosynthesis C-methylase UbiE